MKEKNSANFSTFLFKNYIFAVSTDLSTVATTTTDVTHSMTTLSSSIPDETTHIFGSSFSSLGTSSRIPSFTATSFSQKSYFRSVTTTQAYSTTIILTIIDNRGTTSTLGGTTAIFATITTPTIETSTSGGNTAIIAATTTPAVETIATTTFSQYFSFSPEKTSTDTDATSFFTISDNNRGNISAKAVEDTLSLCK